MRELWARNIALLTGLCVVLLAMMFALIQNPPEPIAGLDEEAASDKRSSPKVNAERPELIAAGQSIYDAQRCAMCHSIAGKGNPRNPLDHVGSRQSAQTIRQWIVASPDVQTQLPVGVIQIKQRFNSLSQEELDALVAYLQSLSVDVPN